MMALRDKRIALIMRPAAGSQDAFRLAHNTLFVASGWGKVPLRGPVRSQVSGSDVSPLPLLESRGLGRFENGQHVRVLFRGFLIFPMHAGCKDTRADAKDHHLGSAGITIIRFQALPEKMNGIVSGDGDVFGLRRLEVGEFAFDDGRSLGNGLGDGLCRGNSPQIHPCILQQDRCFVALRSGFGILGDFHFQSRTVACRDGDLLSFAKGRKVEQSEEEERERCTHTPYL